MEATRNSPSVFSNFDHGLIDYWEITGIVTNVTLLHIGSGKDSSPAQAIDNPVIKLPDGTPFIPGSSLKGVLRSIAEAYLLRIIVSGSDTTACGRLLKDVSVEEFQRECSPFPQGATRRKEVKPYCVNKGLFGGPEIASHIHIFDLLPVNRDIARRTMVKPGVSIDRFLGAARHGLLYNVEVVPPGVEWKLLIRIYGLNLDADNEDDEGSLAWSCLRETLAFILEYMNKGISIGGRTSTGHGLLKIKDVTVKHVYLDPKTGFKEDTITLDEFIKKLRGDVRK